VGNRRTLLAAAAILLAAAAGMGVYFYVSGADKRAEDKVQTVEAFVAVRDIPKGTNGSEAIANGSIAATRVLRGSVPDAAVVDTGDLEGKIASSTIQAKQFITNGSFVAPSEGGGGFLAGVIGSKDSVAVTISFDPARAVANQISPGDRVDMISDGKYLLRGVKVLAIGTDTAATAASGPGVAATSGLITFEVTPDQAMQIVNADSIWLTLLPLSANGADGSVPANNGR
jgi:Flp pilus assembly protein CpaB